MTGLLVPWLQITSWRGAGFDGASNAVPIRGSVHYFHRRGVAASNDNAYSIDRIIAIVWGTSRAVGARVPGSGVSTHGTR